VRVLGVSRDKNGEGGPIGRAGPRDGSLAAGRGEERPDDDGTYRNAAGAGPARREGDASAATETRQGLSDRSVITADL
jgi:hypothetical protein